MRKVIARPLCPVANPPDNMRIWGMKTRQILRLNKDQLPEFIALATNLEQTPGFNWSSMQIQSELEISQAWGLWSDGALRSFVLWREGLDAFEVMALGTDLLWRRQGTMRELLGHLIAHCQKSIWLEVHEANEPAIKLYHDLGFQPTGLRKNYYSDGASAVLMSFLRKDF